MGKHFTEHKMHATNRQDKGYNADLKRKKTAGRLPSLQWRLIMGNGSATHTSPSLETSLAYTSVK